ncbi:hypothetical protein ABPG74_004757 [Tetrahymena malaccensis]
MINLFQKRVKYSLRFLCSAYAHNPFKFQHQNLVQNNRQSHYSSIYNFASFEKEKQVVEVEKSKYSSKELLDNFQNMIRKVSEPQAVINQCNQFIIEFGKRLEYDNVIKVKQYIQKIANSYRRIYLQKEILSLQYLQGNMYEVKKGAQEIYEIFKSVPEDQQNKGFVETLYFTALKLACMNQIEASLKIFQIMLSIHEKNILKLDQELLFDIYVNLAFGNYRLRNYTEVVKIYQFTLSISSEIKNRYGPGILIYAYISYQELKQENEANMILTKLKAIMPEFDVVQFQKKDKKYHAQFYDEQSLVEEMYQKITQDNRQVMDLSFQKQVEYFIGCNKLDDGISYIKDIMNEQQQDFEHSYQKNVSALSLLSKLFYLQKKFSKSIEINYQCIDLLLKNRQYFLLNDELTEYNLANITDAYYQNKDYYQSSQHYKKLHSYLTFHNKFENWNEYFFQLMLQQTISLINQNLLLEALEYSKFVEAYLSSFDLNQNDLILSENYSYLQQGILKTLEDSKGAIKYLSRTCDSIKHLNQMQNKYQDYYQGALYDLMKICSPTQNQENELIKYGLDYLNKEKNLSADTEIKSKIYSTMIISLLKFEDEQIINDIKLNKNQNLDLNISKINDTIKKSQGTKHEEYVKINSHYTKSRIYFEIKDYQKYLFELEQYLSINNQQLEISKKKQISEDLQSLLSTPHEIKAQELLKKHQQDLTF